MMILASVVAGARAKGDWKGKVVDAKGEPVAYANVAVLSKADSTVVCGTVTQEDGTFNIITSETDGIMMVALLGYQTLYLAPVDGAVITLLEDSTLLEGAVTQAVMPKTKLTGEGLQTNVRGSVLENAGTANDVLAKTPGIIKGQNGLEVIGRGSPLVYINGRKVTDATELDRLQSNEIQSIEVITNPGAQYDASVRSVVRIRTVRRQGDGFGFSVNASDAQSLRWAAGNDASAALNANYRTGGVDIFGGINYGYNTAQQISDIQKNSFGRTVEGEDWVFENKGDLLNQYFEQTLFGNAGVNWQVADNHFLGGKVEWGRTLTENTYNLVHDHVWFNGTPTDNLTTLTRETPGPGGTHHLGANLYYNGKIADALGVDVNLDYYQTGSAAEDLSEESSTESESRTIRSTSNADGRLYAAKAVLSYPIWTGKLEVGTEETFSRRADQYAISGIQDIPASQSQVAEDNYAGFLSYGFMLPKAGMFNAGVRYEYVHYAYTDAMTPENNIVRNYGNWFPTASWANAFGPVQVMLNYSAKTMRPNYALLSSAVRYLSRYIWQSGNAQLQPQLTHDISATAVWKFVAVAVEYSRTNGAIMTWTTPKGEDGVTLVQPCNIETPYRAMAAYVNLTPTIGPWNLNYTLGIQPQWLTINAPDPRSADGIKLTRFNGKPIGFMQLFNTVTLKDGWQLELGGMVMTPGYTQNLYLRNWYCDITAAVQKTLLRDGSLVLRLEGRDLAGLAHYDVDTDFGRHTVVQTNLMDTQRVKLSIRYNFNTAKSKYLGTGAGTESRGRM